MTIPDWAKKIAEDLGFTYSEYSYDWDAEIVRGYNILPNTDWIPPKKIWGADTADDEVSLLNIIAEEIQKRVESHRERLVKMDKEMQAILVKIQALLNDRSG
jgi:hypothetical protein